MYIYFHYSSVSTFQPFSSGDVFPSSTSSMYFLGVHNIIIYPSPHLSRAKIRLKYSVLIPFSSISPPPPPPHPLPMPIILQGCRHVVISYRQMGFGHPNFWCLFLLPYTQAISTTLQRRLNR